MKSTTHDRLPNAKQFSSAESLDLLRFVFFQTMSESEFAAYKELVRQEKEKLDSEKSNFNNLNE